MFMHDPSPASLATNISESVVDNTGKYNTSLAMDDGEREKRMWTQRNIEFRMRLVSDEKITNSSDRLTAYRILCIALANPMTTGNDGYDKVERVEIICESDGIADKFIN